MDTKVLVRDFISVVLVLAAVATIWWTPANSEAASMLLKIVGGFIIGFYYGGSQLPTFGYTKKV